MDGHISSSLFSGNMILNLVNDLLDHAKIVNGKFTINNQYFNLNKTIDGAFDIVKYMA